MVHTGKISMDSGADVNPGIRLTINKGIPLTFNGDMTFSSDGRLYVKGEGKRSVNRLKAACNTNTIIRAAPVGDNVLAGNGGNEPRW